MKIVKHKQKYYFDLRGIKELPRLKPGDYVRIKSNHESKEWSAVTAVHNNNNNKFNSYIAHFT